MKNPCANETACEVRVPLCDLIPTPAAKKQCMDGKIRDTSLDLRTDRIVHVLFKFSDAVGGFECKDRVCHYFDAEYTQGSLSKVA